MISSPRRSPSYGEYAAPLQLKESGLLATSNSYRGSGSLGPNVRINSSLHLFMLAACALLLSVFVAGTWLAPTPGWKSLIAAATVLLPVSCFPAVIWNDRREYHKRDAALTLPWIVLLIIFVPYVAVFSGRLSFPLRDALFIKIDETLGFSVPAIMAWLSGHRLIGALLDRSYDLLFCLLPLAILLPALTGRKQAAERFLLANTIAFLLAIPVFTLLPAIGPWAGYHFAGNAEQEACQASIVALHNSRFTDQVAVAGIVCCPSFHVIWAILSAVALWSVKPLRIAASVLAALIVISTVTTGWHYVADVLVGLLFVGIALAGADMLMRGARNPFLPTRHLDLGRCKPLTP